MLCENCKTRKICKLPTLIKEYAPDITLEVTRCAYSDFKTTRPQIRTPLQLKTNKTPTSTLEVADKSGKCPICHAENVILHTCYKCKKEICEACAFTEVDSVTAEKQFICEACWEEE